MAHSSINRIVKKAYFNWSGGKDSALALYYALVAKEFSIAYLQTNVNEHFDRISMHGVRVELLERQARSIGIPLLKNYLPKEPSMELYEEIMQKAILALKEQGIKDTFFGDIFLEELRAYREQNLRKLDMTAHFPLWKRPTRELIHEFIDLDFKTIVVCVNGQKLDRSFAGRIIDKSFVDDLPDDVDPCGENGEFHTFVFDGPIFQQPISFVLGEIITKTYTDPLNETKDVDYYFCDLL